MEDVNAELLVDSRCELGEGIIWDAARACLWWTDIDGRTIWRYDPATRQSERFTPPDRAGFLVVAAGGRLLLGCAKALYMAQPGAGGVLRTDKLADLEADLPTTRANDSKMDRRGNVVFGTLDEQNPRQAIAGFYQYSSAHGLRRPRAANWWPSRWSYTRKLRSASRFRQLFQSRSTA